MYKEINFDDYRCRNIFVSLLKKEIPEAEVFHKKRTAYKKIYISLPEGINGTYRKVKETYEVNRETFIEEVSILLKSVLKTLNVTEKDLSGDEFVKINSPSPYSFIMIREILKSKGITVKDHITSSTAIIGVHDEESFNDDFWKGELKPMVERLEQKINKIQNKFLEEEYVKK